MKKMSMLTKTSNGSKFPTLSAWMDDWLNDDLESFVRPSMKKWNLPRVNIQDGENHFLLNLAAPGLSKKDFKIDVEEDRLTVSCELSSDTETTEGDFVRKEFNYESFSRTFALPDSVDQKGIQATYNDGILKVKLPKRPEAVKQPPRQIAIK